MLPFMSIASLSLSGLSTGPSFQVQRRPASLLLIAAAHVVVVWLFLQADTLSRVVHQVSPLMVALLSEPAPTRPPEPALPVPRHSVQLPTPALMPPPELRISAEAPPAPPAAVVVPVLPPMPASPAPGPVPAEPLPVRALPPVAAPPAPPVLGASAIRYRVPPAIEVPMASRRLGEAGTVLLRVWVDAQGLPRQVSLHRSSGFPRLDEQALSAMRQARFQPVVQPASEGGNAIDWVVIAPLQYEID
jgi:protein TonB